MFALLLRRGTMIIKPVTASLIWTHVCAMPESIRPLISKEDLFLLIRYFNLESRQQRAANRKRSSFDDDRQRPARHVAD